MNIQYRCRCTKGAVRDIVVTDRVPNTDLGVWMQMVVQPSVSYDHMVRSPLCRSASMEEVRIPTNVETGEVGSAPTKQ